MLSLQSGGEDDPMSDNEYNSRDGDSPEAADAESLSRVPPGDVDTDALEKLRQQVRHISDLFSIFSRV